MWRVLSLSAPRGIMSVTMHIVLCHINTHHPVSPSSEDIAFTHTHFLETKLTSKCCCFFCPVTRNIFIYQKKTNLHLQNLHCGTSFSPPKTERQRKMINDIWFNASTHTHTHRYSLTSYTYTQPAMPAYSYCTV